MPKLFHPLGEKFYLSLVKIEYLLDINLGFIQFCENICIERQLTCSKGGESIFSGVMSKGDTCSEKFPHTYFFRFC